MKNFLFVFALVLACSISSAQAQMFGGWGQNDTRTVLSIRPDGSCLLSNEMSQSRSAMEMAVKSWEMYSKDTDELTRDDPDAATPNTPKPEAKKLTDQELSAKLRSMYEDRSATGDEDSSSKLNAVEISSNTVRIVTSSSFGSLKELLSESAYSWGPSLLMVQSARLEMDTNRNLMLTFAPNRDAARYAKASSRQWKTVKTKYTWKVEMPGKVVSSSLPNTQGNATWITIDSDKPETFEPAIKAMSAPVLVTAESSSLALNEPLDSKQLGRSSGSRRGEPDIPITDAAGRFQAEPVSIQVSTTHYFPEAEKLLKDSQAFMYGFGQTGTVVSAKLFAPKGREIRTVSDVHVTTAKDDKGRPVASLADDHEQQSYSRFFSSDFSESDQPRPARIEISFGLPAPDAKSIDRLEAEAVAFTVGGWKELVLTNVQADAQKEIDLNDLVPGAKLVVKKISGKAPQKKLDVTLKGPKTIGQIDFKLRLGNSRKSESNTNERRAMTSTGTQSTRSVWIQAYDFESPNAANSPLTLIVRYPQDPKRERVRFELSGLDLM
jgi:hypothetical protein